MRVSFDFDKTLDRKNIQAIATEYINSGSEVWIITRRGLTEHQEVEAVANQLGIPLDHIIYTSGEWKWRTIQDMCIDLHFDDKVIEIFLIEKMTKTKGILV